MRIDSTTGPGNLTKAGPGTTRYMVTFSVSREGGKGEIRQRAWRGLTKDEAMSNLQRFYEKQGYVCTTDDAVEIPESYKAS